MDFLYYIKPLSKIGGFLFKKSTKITTRNRTFGYCHNIYEIVKDDFNYHSDCQSGIVLAMSIILENLIYRKNLKEYKYFLISLNPNNYTQQNKESLYYKFGITYHDLIHAIEILKYCGIISQIKGGRQYRKLSYETEWHYDYKSARLTTLYLNPINQWKSELNLSALDKMRILSYYKEEDKPLAVIRYKDDKKNILYEVTTQDKKLHKINEWLVDHHYKDLQYQRIYSTKINSTEIGYGRVFNTFQQISKVDRQTICEELNLKEFDFKSCLINIIYALETGKIYEGDIYNDTMNLFNIPSQYHYVYRDIFKKLFIIMLNCNEKKVIPAIYSVLKEYGLIKSKYSIDNFHKYLKENNFPLYTPYFTFTAKIIKKTISESFTILKNYFFTNSSSLTQFLESEICIKIMSIMINDNIIPLSIHDSYYFPIEDYEYYSNLCNSIFYNTISNFKLSTQKPEIIKVNFNVCNLFNFKIYNYSLLNNIIIKMNNNKINRNLIDKYG
jgi:hypothetical protein